MKAIHRYLFQDVYAWAGEFRTVNMGRARQAIFAHFGQLEQFLASVFQALAAEMHQILASNPEKFAARSAYYMGEINAAHPFREGNGRTQREFIKQLADEAGFAILWNRVERARLYAASEISFRTGKYNLLAELLQGALTKRIDL